MLFTQKTDEISRSKTFTIEVEQNEIELLENTIREQLIAKVTDRLAQDYLDNHMSSIMESISPTAVANLAFAKAANNVAETLSKPITIIESPKRKPWW